MGKDTYRLRSRIYIAGPITLGDIRANVRQAVAVGARLLTLGYAPFIPHLSHYMDPYATWTKNPFRYEQWLDADRSFIAVCDALLRLPGTSKGADREVLWAHEIGIPVYTDLRALLDSLPPTQPFEVSHS